MIGGLNAFRKDFLTPEQQLLACGDLIVPSQLSHVQFEMKFYKDLNFHSFYENNEQLNKWITQAKGSSDKIWFLVFKINNKGRYMVFDKTHINTFKIPDSYTIYKKEYCICLYDGFFEQNKQTLLDLKKCSETLSISPTLSSTETL